jgi:aspartate/methionine/tyrosine aminotransferase
MLDSPSNPLGFVTGFEDLERLAVACGQSGAVLVVDHCFLLAGLHAPNMLPSVFAISGETCDWVGIWDTGKSIDVSGDKIGFIVPGNQRMATILNDALAVIQPASYSARRAIEVFSRLLGAAELNLYLAEAGKVCRSNVEYLQSRVGNRWSVPMPPSGTFACVYAPDLVKGSDQLRSDWMAAGVSAAAGSTFFPSTFASKGEGVPFLRVSLLRDPKYFQAAIDCLPSMSDVVS